MDRTFLPHISTDAIQTTIDWKLASVLYQVNWVPRAINIRDENAELKFGASLLYLFEYKPSDFYTN